MTNTRRVDTTTTITSTPNKGERRVSGCIYAKDSPSSKYGVEYTIRPHLQGWGLPVDNLHPTDLRVLADELEESLKRPTIPWIIYPDSDMWYHRVDDTTEFIIKKFGRILDNYEILKTDHLGTATVSIASSLNEAFRDAGKFIEDCKKGN